MLELLFICFIGGVCGALLQGMLGIGNGIICVPLLTLMLPHYGIPTNIAIHIAFATSLAVIATNTVSAISEHRQLHNIHWPLVKRILLFSIIGSFVGALLASYTKGNVLKIIFILFMLLTACFMIIKKSIYHNLETIPDISWSKIITGGFSIGLIASIVGSGGGLLMVPFLHLLKLKMRYAVGTSTMIGLPVAISGTLTYMIIGILHYPPIKNAFGLIYWPAFLAFTCAGILCVPWGVKLSVLLPTLILQRLFGIIIIMVAIKMLM